MFLSLSTILHSPRILLTRFAGLTVVAVVSLCSIAYLTWFLPPSLLKSELQYFISTPLRNISTAGKGQLSAVLPKRLIVFGDSWSDNGQYPIDPPPRDQCPEWEQARGKVWTDWLCLEIRCTYHDNFARTLPYSGSAGHQGAVVDNEILKTALINGPRSNRTDIYTQFKADPIADLRAQVQQWLRFERSQLDMSRKQETARQSTIFLLWFSLWDIWYLSAGSFPEGQTAVTRVLDSLFEQLHVIADNWPSKLKIVMPGAFDCTFLPAWQNLRTGPTGSDLHADDQRNVVLFVEQWNLALDMRATRWTKGEIYIYNTNDWLLEQLLEQQLSLATLTDANGLGSHGSLWSNTHEACTRIGHRSGDVSLDLESVSRCSDPDTYLFWDDMHLGPEAMRIIGQGVAESIVDNPAITWLAHEIESKL